MDFIEINKDGATTNLAGAGRFWVSGTTPFFNNAQILTGGGTVATIAANWDNGAAALAPLAMADYGAVANAISTAGTKEYLYWDNNTSTLHPRNVSVGSTFTMSSIGIDAIKDQDDMSSDSATALATQQSIKAYVDDNAGGSPGGSDTQVQFNDGGSFGGSADFTWDDTNLQLLDSKNLVLGTGDDFKLYHNGSNSYIENNTGDILIRNLANDADIKVKITDNTTETEVMRIVGATSTVGIGTTAPAAKLDVLSTTEQLRLSYDGSNYASFTVASDSDLNIDTSGYILLNADDTYNGIRNVCWRPRTV